MMKSNIQWIGEYPNSWKLDRLSWHMTEINEKNNPIKTTKILSLTNKLGVVPYEEKGNQGNVAKENHDEYKLAYPNTIVANSMNILIGSVGKCDYFGCVSPVYYVFKPNKNENIDFLNYIFQTEQFQKELRCYANGILEIRLRLSSNDIIKREIPYPPLPIQNKIVAVLNDKTSKIDALIENENKQIEKLKEYRQAIITKAVTKGLNPNVPMKDSGIEWIGEIPNNVNVSSVKKFYDITLGKMLQPEQESENDTMEYYFCAANLGNNCLKTDDLKQMWFSAKEKGKYSLKIGDLLVVEGGDVASSSIIGTDVSNIYFQNSIHRVRPIHGLNEYLHYYLIFVKGSGYFDVNCNKATIMHFTKDKFSNLPFLIRNIEEQKKIVIFLNKEETKINRLISIKEKKIEFLKNHKKSLIYEYVTGKKRVSL